MWMCDDDSLDPGILPEYVDFLLNNPGYSLVSGQITYWIGGHPIYCERDFNIEHNWRMARLLRFYYQVVCGSIFYGLMPRHIAKQIPLESRMGDDWHFVATLAYLGKIKNLDRIGYHKKSGGISKNFKVYGKAIGATSFATRFPHFQIAVDAFSNILHHSPVYASQPFLVRMGLAFFSFCSLIVGHYGKLYPFILGGKIKRLMGFKTSKGAVHNA